MYGTVSTRLGERNARCLKECIPIRMARSGSAAGNPRILGRCPIALQTYEPGAANTLVEKLLTDLSHAIAPS